MPAPDDDNASASPLGAARKDYQAFRRGVIALVVVACAGPLSLNVADPDLWGHVLYGQEWIAEGRLPRTATHTFTAEGTPWVNHENLAELLLAHGFRALGLQGMLAAKVVLGMTILLLMSMAARRQGVRPVAAWATFLLVAHNLHAFFPLRPQLLSFLACAVMLLALDRAFAPWGNRRSDFRHTRRKTDHAAIDWRWLAPLPPLMALWANTHGGFVAGVAILSTFLVGRAIEVVLKLRREGLGAAAGLLGVAVASAAATLLNPYGAGLHRWLWESLGAPRPEITEWLPATPDNPVFWPFVTLLVVAAVALAVTDRRRDPVKVVILALVAWQAVTHLRHVAFFALVCGFWLPPHVQSIASRLRGQAARGLPTASLGPWMRRGVAAAIAAGIALQALSLGRRVADLPVPRSTYPVDALQWMADQGVKGNLVVAFNWAQYTLAALGPEVRVSFDGRYDTCYPQEVIDRYFDFHIGDRTARYRAPGAGPIDPARTLAIDRPDFVLVDRLYSTPRGVMERAAAGPDAAWSLVYQDGVAQLWGRRSLVDDPASPGHVPAPRRFVSDHLSTTAVTWPALPLRRSAGEAFGETDEVARRGDKAATRPYHEG